VACYSLRMTENRRDAGLVRSIGTKALAASIVNAVVGASIFALPGALAACMGVYAPLAFLLCGVAVGSVALCYAEGGSRIPTSGGPYGYIDAAFGPLAGYVAGTLLLLSNALSCGGLAAALADVVVSLLPHGFQALAHAVVIISVIGGFALINVAGAAYGARLIDWATVVKMIPLLLFVIVGASAMHRANFAPTVAPTTKDLGRALILCLFALTGMEVSLSASGEVARPSRTIPRALGIALVSVTLLYVAIQITAQGILGASLALSSVPLADAMGHISPALRDDAGRRGALHHGLDLERPAGQSAHSVRLRARRDASRFSRARASTHAYTLCSDFVLRRGGHGAGVDGQFRRVGGPGHTGECRAVCRGQRRGLAPGA
jgi:APA family basic amino acid/polyamine antiporter